MSDNPHETAARLAKAVKMADIIAATGMTVASLEESRVSEPELTEEMWLAVATQAAQPNHPARQPVKAKRVRKPSDTTKALVLELLRNREKAAHRFNTGRN